MRVSEEERALLKRLCEGCSLRKHTTELEATRRDLFKLRQKYDAAQVELKALRVELTELRWRMKSLRH